MTFDEAYKSLNSKQKEAVDTIDGPVMVVAGPGTGKTQLLAMRAANILQKDSTLLPTNVLCLTFTESGQVAMQRRLIELMGEAGAHVAVHTFHSFGTEIINSYPQYFYKGANYSPADELTTHEILVEILENLPYRNPLASQNQSEFVYLKAIKTRLQELKKAAVTPEELRELAMDGLKFIEYIETSLTDLFDVASFSSTKDIERSQKLLDTAMKYKQPELTVLGFKPLSKVFIDTFGQALAQAIEINKTPPINNWKKDWFTRDKSKKATCKQRDVLDKLLALSDVYQDYQTALDTRRLFDFDDMIVRVVHALETRGDLGYELQEQYQYFLVDEFQDTNAGQLRLLHALANHPVNENRPNVLVVGDDDQAIYAFQGAELNNILGFKESYTDVKLITLNDNYRSAPKLLDVHRQLIVQGVDRLETHYKEIDKTLLSKTKTKEFELKRQLFTMQAHEYEWVANEIRNLIHSGQKANGIAVICREHKYLEALLPYLYELDIPVSYERRQNALNNMQIKELIVLARVVEALSRQDETTANGFLAELLSAEYWQIEAADIWRLSLAVRQEYEAKHKNVFWLELMLAGKHGAKLKTIAEFLLESAKFARSHSLEQIMDMLIGNTAESLPQETYEESETVLQSRRQKYISSFKDYYFSDDILKQKPENYITLLSCLSAVRNHLRRYRADTNLNLTDFIHFVDLCMQAGVTINVTGLHAASEDAVQLMSAHGSKGLEFKTVFLLSSVNKIWDSKTRGSLLPLAPSMLQVAHTNNLDDNLRLFYVAATRAKNNLIITGYLEGDDGKQVTSFGALEDPTLQAVLPSPAEPFNMPDSAQSRLNRAERQWFDVHWQMPHREMKDLLAKRLETYKLSVTHLNNYLDVTQGGPVNFLLGNLLQFPSTMSPSAAFGSTMHECMQYLHEYFIARKKLPGQNELEHYFDDSLRLKRLNPTDEKKYLDRGHNSLQAIIQNRSSCIKANQMPEQNFFAQGVMIGNAQLTGKIDILEVAKREATVIDYKTGKAIKSWLPQGKNIYEKIKMHKYAQQLYFYKLLVEGSRTWGDQGVKLTDAELVFIEPDKQEDLNVLALDLDNKEDFARLAALVKAVWQRIMNLDFMDVSDYSKDVKGIKAFEDYLIENYK
jgi:DNA helicase-2/ATP-dependent DNA helicase PcrA